MNRSAIPALPIASWTAWCTTRTASNSTANRCARSADANPPRRTASERRGPAPTQTPDWMVRCRTRSTTGGNFTLRCLLQSVCLALPACRTGVRTSARHRRDAGMAQTLRKSEAEIMRCLQELVQAGVCQWIEDGGVEIQDRFWPYERAASRRNSSDAAAYIYVAAIKRLFLSHACAGVRSLPPTR